MKQPENFSLEHLGEAVLTSLVASQQMGHASPAQSALYMQANSPETAFLHDYLTVCASGDGDAAARLAAFVDEQGLADHIAQAVTR